MFESTLVDERSESHRPWTVAVSFLGQSLLVLVAVLIPLLTTEALPTAEWMGVLLAPPPPLGAPPPAPRAPQEAAAVAPQQFNTDAFVAPATIPAEVAINVVDTGQPQIGDGPSITGIGSVPGIRGGVADAVWTSAPRVIPKPPSPPEVKLAKKAAPQAVRVSTLVQSAKLIRKVAPVYPHLAKAAGISGVVNMEAIIGHDGTVRKLQVMSGHPLLIQAAKDAVSQWRYRPTILNGEPVEVLTRIEVKFVLR